MDAPVVAGRQHEHLVSAMAARATDTQEVGDGTVTRHVEDESPGQQVPQHHLHGRKDCVRQPSMMRSVNLNELYTHKVIIKCEGDVSYPVDPYAIIDH